MNEFLLCSSNFVFTFSVYNVVDFIPILPIWVTFNKVKVQQYNDINTVNERMVWIMFGLSTTRILRLLRIRKKVLELKDDVQRQIGDMILSILVLILFSESLE